MTAVTCEYFYNKNYPSGYTKSMNYIKCPNAFVEQDTEYEIGFRLSLFNFEPSNFITELRIGTMGGDIYNYEATHEVTLSDRKESQTGFFPLTGFPNYDKRQMNTASVMDLGGNFGEINMNLSDNKKWIPWVRPQVTGKKFYFRFKTNSATYSSGAW